MDYQILNYKQYFPTNEYGVHEVVLSKLHLAEEAMQEDFDRLLEQQSCIGLTNCNHKDVQFQKYVDKAKENGYKVISLVLENRHDEKSTQENINALKAMIRDFEITL